LSIDLNDAGQTGKFVAIGEARVGASSAMTKLLSTAARLGIQILINRLIRMPLAGCAWSSDKISEKPGPDNAL
jgi:hypothetical protein